MRIVTIVQARMASTRLPGKILKEVLGKSLLEYQVERLRRIQRTDDLILATTVNSLDNRLVELCENWRLNCFRGSEDDFLDRYYHAALDYPQR